MDTSVGQHRHQRLHQRRPERTIWSGIRFWVQKHWNHTTQDFKNRYVFYWRKQVRWNLGWKRIMVKLGTAGGKNTNLTNGKDFITEVEKKKKSTKVEVENRAKKALKEWRHSLSAKCKLVSGITMTSQNKKRTWKRGPSVKSWRDETSNEKPAVKLTIKKPLKTKMGQFNWIKLRNGNKKLKNTCKPLRKSTKKNR